MKFLIFGLLIFIFFVVNIQQINAEDGDTSEEKNKETQETEDNEINWDKEFEEILHLVRFLKQLDKGLEKFAELEKHCEETKCDKSTVSRIYYEKGAIYEIEDQPEEAMIWVKKALEEDPENYLAAFLKAGILAKGGDLVDAIEAFKEAGKLDDKDPLISFNIGWAYLMLQSFDESISWFEETLKLDPGYFKATKAIRQAERQKKQYEKEKNENGNKNDERTYEEKVNAIKDSLMAQYEKQKKEQLNEEQAKEELKVEL